MRSMNLFPALRPLRCSRFDSRTRRNWPMSLRNCSHQQLNNRATTIAAINLVVVAAIRSAAAAIHLEVEAVAVALAVDWEEGLVLAAARLVVEVVVVVAEEAVAVR